MSSAWRVGGPGYGVVEYTDGRARFICFGPLSVAALTELCAVARKHGAKTTSTAGWLIKRLGVSEPKEKLSETPAILQPVMPPKSLKRKLYRRFDCLYLLANY